MRIGFLMHQNRWLNPSPTLLLTTLKAELRKVVARFVDDKGEARETIPTVVVEVILLTPQEPIHKHLVRPYQPIKFVKNPIILPSNVTIDSIIPIN